MPAAVAEDLYRDAEVAWEPQPGPQAAFVACPLEEVFYGGARGGGKTDASIGDWLEHSARCGQAARGVFFRRELVQLDEAIERAKVVYGRAGAQWLEQKKTFIMPGGGRLKFRYLERDSDAEKYQGHSYTRVYLEELTNFPSAGPVLKLLATLRSAEGADVGLRGTGNPGGPGHNWVKARYVDPAPLGYRVITEEYTNPFNGRRMQIRRVFIPAKLSDNPKLLENDPLYVARLQQAGPPALVRAWLEGDWNAPLGNFFPEFGLQHIIPDQELPEHWARYLAFDWGSASPFCVLWIAVSDGSLEHIPAGALVVYREWYGAKLDGEQWVGLKLEVEEIAKGIRERCALNEHRATNNVAGPDLFKRDGGPSLAERMFKAGVRFREADNTRIPGWDQVRQRLKGHPDTGPALYVTESCTHLIRTLPALPHDQLKIEDVDTESEDHAADALRYGCMARPYVRERPQRVRGPKYGTYEWLLKVTGNEQPKRSKYRL